MIKGFWRVGISFPKNIDDLVDGRHKGGAMRIQRVLQARVALLIVVAMVATSCGGTTLTSVWKDKAYQKRPQHILVMGLVWNPANRKVLEDEFVRQLKADGVNAAAGYTVFPEDKPPSKDAVAAKLKENGSDTLLLAKVVDRETSGRYVEEASSIGMRGGWADYYGGGYVTQTEQTYVFVQVKLFDVETEKPIWSATSETAVRSDTRSEIKAYVARILKALQKEKLIG